MHWQAINHIQMLLQRCVHECNTVLAELIICWNVVGGVLVPLNLTAANAIVANLAEALRLTRTEEPNAAYLSVIIIISLNWHKEVESVVDLLPKVNELVPNIRVQVRMNNLLHHFQVGPASLIVVVAGHEAPRNIVAIHGVEELIEVSFPEVAVIL